MSTTTINRVLILIDAKPSGGTLVLRGLQGWQTVLAEKTLEFPAEDFRHPDAHLNGDHAKLIAIIKAFKHLTRKLPSDQDAAYEVVIVQPSQNVQRWVTEVEKRKTPVVKELTGYVDRLRRRFPKVQFAQRDRQIINDLMNGSTV